MAAVELFGLVWQRPWGALALLGAVLIWWLAARSGRGAEVWTGTLAVWREVAQPTEAQERRARRLPPGVLLLIAALVTAALALAGPHAPAPLVGRTWTVVVDRSPSMYLNWVAPDREPQRQITRLGRARELAREVLESVREPGDRVVWIAYEQGTPSRMESESFPDAWMSTPLVPQSEPPWSSHDAWGTLWLTDTVAVSPAQQAGLVSSGGGAVPGFVAALGTTRVEWNGEQLVERAAAGPRPQVWLGAVLEGPVERVVQAWAEARGCEVVASRSAQVVLELVRVSQAGADGPPGVVITCGRDGWTWEVGPFGGRAPQGEAWLSTLESGEPVVAWGAGRISLARGPFVAEPEGDPADFALSWSTLLDGAALPPEGVVAVSERRAAGPEFARPPAPSRGGGAGTPPGLASALLAGLAAVLVLAAALVPRG